MGYAPKEQYIRRGRQGPYTDVYSCAACFYAALTGYLPPESLERLDHDELVPVSQAGVAVPEWLDKAILKGLAVQPEDRFQSAAEFLDAIENQLVVDVPAAGQTAPAQPVKKKFNPLVIGGIAAAIVVAVGLGAVLGGRGSGGNGDGGGGGGGGIMEALAPKVTIAGHEVSTATEFLELVDGTFTDADVETLKQLGSLKRIYLDGVTIETEDLSWVAQFPRLTEFSCEGYLMDELDLTPFAGLTELERLGFYQNGNSVGMAVSDLSPLAGLTKMKRLDLNISYDVTDLSPLAGMTQLEHMQLFSSNSGNSRSGITDLSPLAELTRLNYLRLDIGNVEDFSPLSGLTALTELRFYGDYIIEDLSFLQGLTELHTLQMSGSGGEGAPVLDDLTALSGLTKLTDLQLRVPVASLDGLEGATALRTLRMYGSGSTYTDVDALAGLTGLVELNLPYRRYDYENPLPPVDISGLKNLTKLQTLVIDSDTASLEPLRGLTELRSLWIQSNDSDAPALSLEPLSGLTKLTDLQFYGRVQNGDLSGLSGLAELRALQIHHYSWNGGNSNSYTYIRDLSPLSGLTKLNSLQVNGAAENIDTSPVSFVSDLNISN